MADLLPNGERLRGDEDMPPHDDASQLNPGDPDSGGDGDDYSSGSDRSYEPDDADGVRRDSPSSGTGQLNADGQVRSRRKRRHGSHGSRRQKGGSRHKPKGFHPYPPKDEMKRKSMEIKEKENAAADLRREEGDQEFVKYPAAPFNSTQFLMDEHNVASPVGTGLHKTASSSKLDTAVSSPFTLSSVQTTPLETNMDTSNWDKPNAKDNKEFAEIYSSLHAESLQSLPKEELVKHYMNLEEQVAVLQKKVAEQTKKGDDGTKMDDGERESVCDSASVSDTNSLSSANEDFLDLAAVNQPTISVGESEAGSCRAMRSKRENPAHAS